MTLPVGSFIVDPGGTSVVVSAVKGVTTATLYADANGNATLSNPSTISTRTVFYVDQRTTYTVTVAGTAYPVDMTNGGSYQVPYPSASGSGTSESLITARLGRRRNLPRPDQVDVTMASPPTFGALATATAIGSAKDWPSTNGSSASAVGFGLFRYRGGSTAAGMARYGDSFPDYLYVKSTTVTSTNAATGAFCVDFMFDGTLLEIQFKGLIGNYRVRVDGQIAATGAVTATGSTYYLPITFASRGTRRITFESAGLIFGGVTTGPNDTIWRPEVRSPRVIVVGDSFTEGTGATQGAASCWVRKMSEALGWLDTWVSGVGTTGYLNPGSAGRVKFRDRLTNDVTQWAPDVVMWAGGINDYGSYTAAAIGAEALACYQAVQAAVPDVIQIVVGPFWRNGVETFPNNLLDTRDAIRTSALAASTPAQPVYFVDLLELPLGVTAPASTLTANSAVNATTISVAAVSGGNPFSKRDVIELGSGASRERRVITGISGSGPYTLTVAALSYAHNNGDAVTQVGQCFWTGSGHVGATTGSGNSDLLVGSDGTHPTQAGHDAIGLAIARLIAGEILAA